MRALMCCVASVALAVPVVGQALSEPGGRLMVRGMVSPLAAIAQVSLPALEPAPLEVAVAREAAPSSDSNPLAGMLVADAQLDDMRGGFEASSGLRVAFGIERVVMVNGQLAATTTFNVVQSESGFRVESLPREAVLGGGGLRVFTGGQGGAAASIPINLGVIQIGPNNVASINPAALAGTLIQNTLDRQQIQNITTINAQVNSVELMRASRLQENLRAAMVGSFRR